MKTIVNPPVTQWNKLTSRPVLDNQSLTPLVRRIFMAVRQKGDAAVSLFSKKYDGVTLSQFVVQPEEIDQAMSLVPQEFLSALSMAMGTITKFHQALLPRLVAVSTLPGVECWREFRPVETVGIYIPGGTAPLFSTVLMLAIPAKIAGCKNIVACTPPGADGKINPMILAAARMAGVTTILKIGGIQAIAAMTFGTETVPKTEKIFGPGNQFVTAAKQMAQFFGTAIDMPAGPSELLIIADKNADPEFVAADLLSQAEHGEDSQVLLLSDSMDLVRATKAELKNQLKSLPRRKIAAKSLQHSACMLFPSLEQCLQFSNAYAPEHLILSVNEPDDLTPLIQHAGSVFLGKYSCESAGDYASGTNHTLPTNGFARAYSGVTTESFMKSVSFQKISAAGLNTIGPTIEIMADAEQLMAHKMAVTLRLNKIRKGMIQ